jgi:anti-anti-sigma regulatory factor
MNTPSAQVSVMAGKRFACVKVQGRANFAASLDFNLLLNQLRERGFNYFVIELSDCALMDSTFLGVLAGFGLKLSQSNGSQNPGCVELRNANARISELLENIGVLHLFKTAQGELESPEQLEAFAHECIAASRQEVTRTCLEAHKTLIEINPENEARFKDVTKFLAEDLARITKSEGT